MGTVIATLLKNHWMASGVTLAALMLLGVCMWQRNEIAFLNQRNQLCRAEGQALALSNTSLFSSLQQQNAAVMELSKQSKQKKAESKKALETAKNTSLKLAKRAQEIHKIAFTGDECTQIKAMIDSYRMP